MTSLEQTIQNIFNEKREDLFNKYCSEGSINISKEQFNELYTLTEKDMASILPIPTRTKIKRPQSGYFIYLNSNRSKISEILNDERRKTFLENNDPDESEPWKLSGKDKVTEVTRRAGVLWKEMSEEEKKPFLDQAAVKKQEWELEKQTSVSTNVETHSNGEAPLKKRRGRPPGSKNKKKKDSAEASKPSPKKSKTKSPEPVAIPKKEEESSSIVVKKMLYGGTTYLLDQKSGDVYDIESEDVIGTFDGSEIKFN